MVFTRTTFTENNFSMAYIFANNSPSAFQTQDDLQSLATDVTDQANNALLLGDFSYISNLSKNGERMLEQIRGVEVPEAMVETHLKALRMAKYAISLKDELVATQNNTDDPLKNIATLSKIQGFMNTTLTFATEFESKLAAYGIDTIPLQL
jgi:V8-like Glu-specific endopeptidase